LGIDIENKDTILPQFQHLEAGEFIGLNEKGQGAQVVSAEPNHHLVLQWSRRNRPGRSCFTPNPEALRACCRGTGIRGSGPGFRLGMAFMEPGCW
jgi:hypothetical protein